MLNNVILLVILIIIGFLVWLFLNFTPPVFCPGAKSLRGKGYTIKYRGQKEMVEGISFYDDFEVMYIHPKIWAVYKKFNGYPIVIGKVIAMGSKTYFTSETLPHRLKSTILQGFLETMKEIKAIKH